METKELVGIDENKIDKLVLDLYNSIEKINNILNNIDNEMNKVNTYFDCTAGKSLYTKFASQKNMFPIINDNFMKDTELLIKVKSRTIDFSKDLAEKIVRNASGVTITPPRH